VAEVEGKIGQQVVETDCLEGVHAFHRRAEEATGSEWIVELARVNWASFIASAMKPDRTGHGATRSYRPTIEFEAQCKAQNMDAGSRQKAI
jgi:hypothetical protein